MNPLVCIILTLFSLQFSFSSAKLHSPRNRSLSQDNKSHRNRSIPQDNKSLPRDTFLQCLASHSKPHYIRTEGVVYAKDAPSYSSILQSKIQNLRFNSSRLPKPLYIITPRDKSHVRLAVICSKKLKFEVRVRSGGHDYEGLSYTSPRPFVIVDLANLRKITINDQDETASVEAGATLGELYYEIGKKDNDLAFPAGLCPTIGVGGHISGGGRGTLMRKYGLSADNVLDAVLVDVKGKILNRKSMGEDLFWAIRGGGAASFGVVVSWKIKLVRVPPKVTVFSITEKIEEGATKMVHKWQHVAHKLPRDLFIRLVIKSGGDNKRGENALQAVFLGLYLGRSKNLIPLMKSSFPELGLKAKNCREMSWLESVLYFDNGYSKNESTKLLLDRKYHGRAFFKAKSDFVTKSIPEKDLQEIWERFLFPHMGIMIWDPSGGRMSELKKDYSPYPHRAGNLFSIMYYTRWEDKSSKVADKHTDWINIMYNSMSPFVSKNPRGAYLNYRDLDLGRNEYGKENYMVAAKGWGRMYFKDNFERLARIKKEVDPENFFRNEQSIPPLEEKEDA